jgi:hypothetical protein
MGLMMGSFGANVTSFVCLIHDVVASLNMAWVFLCVRPLEGSVPVTSRLKIFVSSVTLLVELHVYKMTKLCMYG